MRCLILAVVIATGCTHTPAPVQRFQADPTKYAAIVRKAARSLEDTDSTPESDVCENCNGTGQIGDGRTMMKCPVCDGTGKATSAAMSAGMDDPNNLYEDDDPEPPKLGPVSGRLTVKSREDCEPCKAFIARDWPEIQKALPGWQLEIVESTGEVPTITIETHDGRTFTHKGRLSLGELQDYTNR